MNETNTRFSKYHAWVSCIVLTIEYLIARYAHDSFIRPYVGDALVSVLIYSIALTFRDFPRVRLALCVFAFAASVELLQACHAADHWGLARGSVLRVMLGATFDVRDLAAYASGALACVVVESLAARGIRAGKPSRT